MTYFTLAWLREGMIVQRTVSDAKGQVLIKAGSALTTQDLARLHTEGVKGVEVQMQDNPGGIPEHSGDTPESPEQIEQRLLQRFRHLDQEYPLVKELLRLCRLREMLHHAEMGGYDG